jgi:drug/metabolite transporter (DMT)-like permease
MVLLTALWGFQHLESCYKAVFVCSGATALSFGDLCGLSAAFLWAATTVLIRASPRFCSASR